VAELIIAMPAPPQVAGGDYNRGMSKYVITTDKAPAAIGPYSQGARVGNLVFTAGQIALGTLQEAGRAASLVPIGAAIGKGTGTLVTSLSGSVAEDVATDVAGAATGGLRLKVNPNTGELGGINISGANAGKAFTRAQKRDILEANRAKNGGELQSDLSGETLVPSQKSTSGVTPPANEAQVDHIVPRAKGGQNTVDNAQVLSRKENRAKSDTLPNQ